MSVDAVQMTELQDSLEAEQYFTTLYKTQVKELKEEVDDRTKLMGELEKDLLTSHEQVRALILRLSIDTLTQNGYSDSVLIL